MNLRKLKLAHIDACCNQMRNGLRICTQTGKQIDRNKCINILTGNVDNWIMQMWIHSRLDSDDLHK